MRSIFTRAWQPGSSRRPATPAIRRRTVSGRGGFTIPEVAIAAFVLAFGIASSIVALQMGFRNLDVARGNTLASQIMQSEIERLRLMNFTQIAALAPTEAVDLATMFSGSAAIASRFAVTRTVATDATRVDVRYITITVQWESHNGQSHTRSFTSMYVKNGLYDYYYTLAKA